MNEKLFVYQFYRPDGPTGYFHLWSEEDVFDRNIRLFDTGYYWKEEAERDQAVPVLRM